MEQKKFIPLLYDKDFQVEHLEKLLQWCIFQEVSDITIQNEEQIICEINGKKHHITKKRLTKPEVARIITRLHSEGAVSTLNRGEDLDFAWTFKKDRDITYRFRVNAKSIYTLGEKGFSLSMRFIKNNPVDLESLKLPQDMIESFTRKRGLVFVTGPTGSGKTTLLSSIVRWRLQQQNSHLKISTYENPIEFTYDDVEKPTSLILQMEIGVHISSFALGIRSALRDRSDVVMIGESRDYETISAALNAAMTGPMVYTTCHTNNVSETLARLINVFPENERKSRLAELIDNLQLIVTQQLIPSVDGKRIAIQEYLIFNQEIKDVLHESSIDKITYTMRKLVKECGQTFLKDLTEKYQQKIITEDTFERVKKEFK